MLSVLLGGKVTSVSIKESWPCHPLLQRPNCSAQPSPGHASLSDAGLSLRLHRVPLSPSSQSHWSGLLSSCLPSCFLCLDHSSAPSPNSSLTQYSPEGPRLSQTQVTVFRRLQPHLPGLQRISLVLQLTPTPTPRRAGTCFAPEFIPSAQRRVWHTLGHSDPRHLLEKWSTQPKTKASQ